MHKGGVIMGKGRKSHYINKITSKDTEMLKAFSNVGYLSHDQINLNLGIAERRIVNFQRDKLIEKVSYLNKETKNADFAYRLSEKGKELCSNLLGITNYYKSSSPAHDMGLSKSYFSCDKDIRDNWITEGQWRTRMQEYLDNLQVQDHDRWEELNEMWLQNIISPPDGGYITKEGVEVGVEIITSSYGEAEIISKEIFAQVLEIEYNQIRI